MQLPDLKLSTLNLTAVLFLFITDKFLKQETLLWINNLHVCLCIQVISRFCFHSQNSTKSRFTSKLSQIQRAH